ETCKHNAPGKSRLNRSPQVDANRTRKKERDARSNKSSTPHRGIDQQQEWKEELRASRECKECSNARTNAKCEFYANVGRCCNYRRRSGDGDRESGLWQAQWPKCGISSYMI